MKRKIKDFKDFLECIKAGKKVIENDKYFYYFENGCICYKDKDGFGWYNTAVDTEDLERMYVEEQETLKIEVGKFYKTRDGKKAYCFYKEAADRTYPNQFVIDGKSGYETCTDDGLLFKYEENHRDDIIGYWEE